jgi:hypothetical protein
VYLARWNIGVLQNLLIVSALAACSAFTQTYDGWTVGALEACPPPNVPMFDDYPAAWDCDASLAVWLTAAREGFDRRDPDHPPVVQSALHHYAGNAKFLSNCCLVAVFELADGSKRAIGVAHLGVVRDHVVAVDEGPD